MKGKYIGRGQDKRDVGEGRESMVHIKCQYRGTSSNQVIAVIKLTHNGLTYRKVLRNKICITVEKNRVVKKKSTKLSKQGEVG